MPKKHQRNQCTKDKNKTTPHDTHPFVGGQNVKTKNEPVRWDFLTKLKKKIVYVGYVLLRSSVPPPTPPACRMRGSMVIPGIICHTTTAMPNIEHTPPAPCLGLEDWYTVL